MRLLKKMAFLALSGLIVMGLLGCVCELEETQWSGTEEHLIRIKLSSDNFSGTIASQALLPDLVVKACCFSHGFSIEVDGDLVVRNSLIFNLIGMKSDGSLSFSTGEHSGEGSVIRLIPFSGSTPLTIASWERRPEWNLELNDNYFRGVLEFRVIERVENNVSLQELVVINELPLGDYIRGVAEVTEDTTHAEKKKAMAVAARSYAAYYLDHHKMYTQYPDPRFNGDDSPDSFQKYLGAGFETRAPLYLEAVSETANLFVLFEDEIAITPYFSSSAGKTLSAEAVWGRTDLPYLISVDDAGCTELTDHGVGMSGCGAQLMAEEGSSYEEILLHYYTGVILERR